MLATFLLAVNHTPWEHFHSYHFSCINLFVADQTKQNLKDRQMQWPWGKELAITGLIPSPGDHSAVIPLG